MKTSKLKEHSGIQVQLLLTLINTHALTGVTSSSMNYLRDIAECKSNFVNAEAIPMSQNEFKHLIIMAWGIFSATNLVTWNAPNVCTTWILDNHRLRVQGRFWKRHVDMLLTGSQQRALYDFNSSILARFRALL